VAQDGDVPAGAVGATVVVTVTAATCAAPATASERAAPAALAGHRDPTFAGSGGEQTRREAEVHPAAAVGQAPASAGGKAARRHCSDGGRAPADCACISGRHHPAGLGHCFINGNVNCMMHCAGHNDIEEVSERSSIVRTPSLAPPTPYTGSIGLKNRSAAKGEELLVMTSFDNRPGHCTWPQPPDCATVSRHVK